MIPYLLNWWHGERIVMRHAKGCLEHLSEYVISGVATTIPFCAFVVSHPHFHGGKYDIQFVEKYFHPNELTTYSDEELAASLIAASAYHSAFSDENHAISDRAMSSRRWKNRRLEE